MSVIELEKVLSFCSLADKLNDSQFFTLANVYTCLKILCVYIFKRTYTLESLHKAAARISQLCFALWYLEKISGTQK
jgi:hypothetical protein